MIVKSFFRPDAFRSLFDKGSTSAPQATATASVVIDTAPTQALGLVPPAQPKLFPGAQVTVERSGRAQNKGEFVGYTSAGQVLVKTASGVLPAGYGTVVRLDGNQTFRSVLESVPAGQRQTVSAADRGKFDNALAQSVGWRGSSKISDYVAAIRKSGFEVWVVGGAVRDILGGTATRDVDLATSMWVEDVASAARKAGLDTGRTVAQFGTLLLGANKSGLDIATLKGRAGNFTVDLKEDITHRDFTVNALFYDPASGIVADPTGHGLADVQNKTLRATALLGQEHAWLRDNPTAAVRLFKFTLRGYKPTPELLQVVKQNFRSAVSSMDSFRLSRAIDSIGEPRSKVEAEMLRLGFNAGDVNKLYRSRGFDFSFDGDKASDG